MREHEMRMRVFEFLKARMRNMLLPATVGIGLAVGGCAKEGTGDGDASAHLDAIPIYSAPLPDGGTTSGDAAVPQPDGARPGEDLAPGKAEVAVAPEVGAEASNGSDVSVADGASSKDGAMGPDQAVALDSAGRDSGGIDGADRDARSDAGRRDSALPDIVALYIAPIPDAALGDVATKYIAPNPDAADKPGPVPLYMAVLPDAGAADAMAVRYSAVMPDAGLGPLPEYMAPYPQT